MTASLPGYHGRLVTPDGRTDPAFYRWFQDLQRLVQTGDASSAEAIEAIARVLGSPDGSVAGIPALIHYYGISPISVFDTGRIEIDPAFLAAINRGGPPGRDGQDGEDSWVPGPPGKDGVAGLRGAPGMDGVDGEDGWMGPPGVRGADGAPGANGAPGAQGTTVWMQFEDAPDPEVGPRGPQGDMGATGSTGAQGAVGAALFLTQDDNAEVWPTHPGNILVTESAVAAYQPLDATLTALAAANWAANALPIGTGADTLAQTAFAANTFPARASTGNLVAKSITDFGLSLVDDADASAARTTLGLVIGTNVQAYDAELAAIAGLASAANKGIQFTGSGTASLIDMVAGTYTPTLFNTTNVAASTAYLCNYVRLGSVVTVSGRVDIDVTAGSVTSLLGMSLPIASAFTSGFECAGTANCSAVASLSAAVGTDTTNDRANIGWVHTADTANRGWFFTFTYRIV
jgi:hypothetical protein